MVTFNVRDFPRIAQEWAEAGRHHSGCAILVGIDHSEFGTTLRVLEAAFAFRPGQEDWQDYTRSFRATFGGGVCDDPDGHQL